MAAELKIVEEAKKPLSMHPKKFAMWLFMVSVSMLFAAWTSAFIVKRGEGGWSEIIIPSQFYISSVIVLLGSLPMWLAVRFARKDNLSATKTLLLIALGIGLSFIVSQILGYGQLINSKQHFTGGNVSHSFVWILSVFHALHFIGGIVFLLIVVNSAFKFKIHSKNMAQIEMCATFWHFLGGLWLYLFIFLLLNR